MITERLGKHTIERYNSIDELPTERFFTYNRMLLLDSGIGGDMEAVDGHISKIMGYVAREKKEEATQELMNMRNSFYFVIENMNPKHLSYAALIHRIDGKLMTDFSDENLKKLTKQLSEWGANRGFFEIVIEAVKKKFKMN